MLQNDSYDPDFFVKLWAVEDIHFWFRARNQIIKTIVNGVVKDFPPGYRVLEIGCGTGNVLRHLESTCTNGQVIGLDLFIEGLRYAKKRVSCALIQADLHQPPFQAHFDLIGMFDVLEHMSDDKQVLEDVHRLLAPNGILLLTVPAHMSLWSYFDVASHHCRRYAVNELNQKLVETGFKVDFVSPYMASIFPLVWLGRRVAGRGSKNTTALASDELRITPGLNYIISMILLFEARFVAARA